MRLAHRHCLGWRCCRSATSARTVPRNTSATVLSETQTWSDTYDLAVGQELATQAEVAARFARALAMELAPTTATPGTAPPDASAYESYLKGRYYWNKPGDTGLDQALAYFGEGLQVAPTFAAAHAAMARGMVARAEYYREVPRAALARARDAALRALGGEIRP